MRYLCLIYLDEAKMDAMSPMESAANGDDCAAFAEEIRASGRCPAAAALEPVATATTVRVRGGRPLVTDGPFAETKEQLGGFFVVEAHDLDEAIALAAKSPPARLGSVEIRPIRDAGKTSRGAGAR